MITTTESFKRERRGEKLKPDEDGEGEDDGGGSAPLRFALLGGKVMAMM